MKKYVPRLSINTEEIDDAKELENFRAEVSQYSITPTTLKSRLYDNLDGPIFYEQYQHKSNDPVIRFGINLYNKIFLENLKKVVTQHNEDLIKELDDAHEKLSNISGATNYGKFVKHIKLINYENDIIKSAFDYMDRDNKKWL